MSQRKRPALFLDRDGVINEELNYVHTRENFHFIKDIFELCRHAKEAGMAIVVITNQAGIGRGYYDEAAFHELTQWMREVFESNGVTVDAVYFCPFHPEHGVGQYRADSPDRKPNPGMILRAEKDLNLSLSDSILVGDSETDIQAGKRAGLAKTILFSPQRGEKQTQADFTVRSHQELINLFDEFSG